MFHAAASRYGPDGTSRKGKAIRAQASSEDRTPRLALALCAVLFPAPSFADTPQDCTIVRQVVASAATGFAPLRGEATKFTGRDVWRAGVTLPHTGACVVDPAGGFYGSPPVFDCFSADVMPLIELLSACFPGGRPGANAEDPNGDTTEFLLGGVSLTVDRVGRSLRILPF